MPMIRSLYPDDWPAIATAIKNACDWSCQVCGVGCRRPGDAETTTLPVLTVAHWHHDYLEPVTFVVSCCATCHNQHDAHYRWRSRRRRQRERQRAAGQLALGPEDRAR